VIGSRLKRFLRPHESPDVVESGDSDMEFAWMDPPQDPRDPSAWDGYWSDLLAHGVGPPEFDMFCDDRPLIAALRKWRASRVLCAGNGFSMEPRAFAAAGFEVTAVDLSPRALQIAQEYPPNNTLLHRFLDLADLRPGGIASFVVGDLFDANVAPGPFDLIIERRTAQTYGDPSRSRFLSVLADRLTGDGVLFSHCHDSGWRPGEQPYHAARDWFDSNQWPIWSGDPNTRQRGRVAWLFSSTG
jgi:hypothetical protein